MVGKTPDWQPDYKALDMVSREMLDLYKVFPLSLIGGSTLIIAVTDETDIKGVVGDLEAFLGVSIIVQSGYSPEDIQDLITNCYGPESEQLSLEERIGEEMSPEMLEKIRLIEERMRPLMDRLLSDPSNPPSFEEVQRLLEQEMEDEFDDPEFLDDEEKEDEDEEYEV